MQVERIDEMRLTEADGARIARLLRAAFAGDGADFGGRSFFQQHPNVRLVVRDAGRITGHLAMHLRAIRLGEELVSVAGIADVATDPGHRGRGIAGTLVQAAKAEAEASPAQALVLFGDAGVYPANGFQPVRNEIRYCDFSDVRTNGVATGAKEGLMVLPLDGFRWDESALVDLVGFAF